MPRRLDAGVVVALAGALLLVVSPFLDWYGSERVAYSAWTVFEVLDLVVLAIGLLALSTLASRAGIERRAPELPLVGLGGAALLIVVSQLLDPPPAATELDPETGIWLALTGAALVVAGAVMSVAKISLSVEQREVRPAREAPPEADAPAPDDETVKLSESDRSA